MKAKSKALITKKARTGFGGDGSGSEQRLNAKGRLGAGGQT